MLNKDNPLQMKMMEDGNTELEIYKYFRDAHKSMMKIDCDPRDNKDKEVLEILERGNAWHKNEYEKYCKMIKKLNDVNCEGGENGN